jgi:hypothetical protein
MYAVNGFLGRFGSTVFFGYLIAFSLGFFLGFSDFCYLSSMLATFYGLETRGLSFGYS